MLQVTVKAPHKYAGVPRWVGEAYAAEDKYVPAMVCMGWVELAKVEAPLPLGAPLPRVKARRARR